ncbi:MAG: hypothetical protein K6E40_16560 [Desulfovibrio sp.]|nr:hypothetical protein [Desulfovibrio sp.]
MNESFMYDTVSGTDANSACCNAGERMLSEAILASKDAGFREKFSRAYRQAAPRRFREWEPVLPPLAEPWIDGRYGWYRPGSSAEEMGRLWAEREAADVDAELEACEADGYRADICHAMGVKLH